MRTALRAGNSPASVPATMSVTVAWMAMPMSTVGLLNIFVSNMPASIVWLPNAAFIHSVAPMPATMPM